jgi:hypothetical protein
VVHATAQLISIANDLVAAFTFNMSYEPDATGIVLLIRTIKTMRLRRAKSVMHTHTRNLISRQDILIPPDIQFLPERLNASCVNASHYR